MPIRVAKVQQNSEKLRIPRKIIHSQGQNMAKKRAVLRERYHFPALIILRHLR